MDEWTDMTSVNLHVLQSLASEMLNMAKQFIVLLEKKNNCLFYLIVINTQITHNSFRLKYQKGTGWFRKFFEHFVMDKQTLGI